MRIAIASDHAGFQLKESAKAFLLSEHCEVLDFGTNDTQPVDYTDYAEAVGAAVRAGGADRGILLCGSGVGASMAANRIPGVRAGLCHDTYSAHQGVEHDDMNVLVLGGRVVGIELARELIHAFLAAHFSGETRHLRRLAKMTALESPLRALQLFGQSVWVDHLRRSMIAGGELRRLVEEDGIGGAHFATRHVRKGHRRQLRLPGHLARTRCPRRRPEERLRAARRPRCPGRRRRAPRLLPCRPRRRDGYVSLERLAALATDTDAMLGEARRLWTTVARDNLMIKIPATSEGIAAMRQLVGRGPQRQRDAAVRGKRLTAGSPRPTSRASSGWWPGGGDPSRVAGVASFFVGRIDSAVEAVVAERVKTADTPRERALFRSLGGKGGDRQRQADLPAVPGAVQRPALAGAREHAARSRSDCSGPSTGPRTPELTRTCATSKI